MGQPLVFAVGILGNIVSFLVTLAPADVLPRVQEEVDGVVPFGALRGGAPERNAVALLRAADQGPPPPLHQRHRLRRPVSLPHHLPRLRAQGSNGFHRETVVLHERCALRGHGRLPSVLHPGPPPRHHRRRNRRRFRLRRLRRSSHHYQASDTDQERGVHALLALLLPDHQRRRLVLVRPPHERLLHRDAQRAGAALRPGPDGALLRVPEPQEKRSRLGDPGREASRRRGQGPAGACRPPRRGGQP